jgi:hypothetical protein
MRLLGTISTTLLLVGIGFFLFDLRYHLAVSWEFRVLSIREVWTDLGRDSFDTARGMAASFLPSDMVEMALNLPVPVAFLAIAAVFYLPFKILSLLGVGKKKKAA